jgi:phosphoserine phosphatase
VLITGTRGSGWVRHHPWIRLLPQTRHRSRKKHASEFVDSILNLNPRTAAFDCDVTLWAGDAGVGFFDWELEKGLLSPEIANWARQRYADYRAGKVSEEDMCGEMVFMHEGLSETLVQSAANQFFDEFILRQIFPELRQLVRTLLDQGCDVWAVSSSNEWLIRAGMRYFGIPQEKILASAVEVDDGIVTDRLVRVPSGDGKPTALRSVMEAPPEAAFGNSKWDIAMLAMAKRGFAVNPNPDLEDLARQFGWRIYFPDPIEL